MSNATQNNTTLFTGFGIGLAAGLVLAGIFGLTQAQGGGVVINISGAPSGISVDVDEDKHRSSDRTIDRRAKSDYVPIVRSVTEEADTRAQAALDGDHKDLSGQPSKSLEGDKNAETPRGAGESKEPAIKTDDFEARLRERARRLGVDLDQTEDQQRGSSSRQQADLSPKAQSGGNDSSSNATSGMISVGDHMVNKVGYDSNGNRLSPEETKEAIKRISNRISNEESKWTFHYPANNEKQKLFVFMDPTCPICKRLHDAIPELNDRGITVHYLMLARDAFSVGYEGSDTVKSFAKAWCSKSPEASIDRLFAGASIEDNEWGCEGEHMNNRSTFPIMEHHVLSAMFGVQGTPTMFSSEGRLGQGFRTVDGLLRNMGVETN